LIKLQKHNKNKMATAQSLIATTRTSLTPKQQASEIKRVEYEWDKEKWAKEATRKKDIKESNIKFRKSQAIISRLKGQKYDKKGRKITRRQPKFSRAVMGLTKAFLPDESGYGSSQSSGRNIKSSDGRGRPAGTFKKRYVPGYGVVQVPTNIYNKMISEAKAKRRLAEAQRQALYQQQMEANQIAAQTDPRYQQSSEDAWADSEDMEHESNVARVQQQRLLQQQMQQQTDMQRQAQPSLLQRGVRGIIERRPEGISLMGSQREQFQRRGMAPPQQLEPYGRPQIDPTRHQPIEPKVRLFQGNSNLFNSNRNIPVERNIMNQRNELF